MHLQVGKAFHGFHEHARAFLKMVMIFILKRRSYSLSPIAENVEDTHIYST